MTAAFDFNSLAQTLSTGIVDSLVEGTLIAALAAAVLRFARGQSAGVRFAVRFCALLAIALPLLGAAWHSQQAGASSGSHSVLTLPGSLAAYLFAAWALVAAVALARVAVGIWQLRALRKTCVPVDETLLHADLLETLERNRGARSFKLCTSDRVEVPTAIGLVKPAVVLPKWLLEELPADELKQIVLHEVAHLRRFDDWTNLAQKIVKAVLFFHPAAWWMEKELSLEREMACDDAVLAETASPRAYAACLAHLAERSFLRRSLALAQAAVGRIKQTSLRVAKILEGGRTIQPRGRKPAAALVAGFAVVCSIGVAKAPQLVVFANGASGSSISAATNPARIAIVEPANLEAANVEAANHETTIPQSLIVPASARTSVAEFKASQPRFHRAASPKPAITATMAWTSVKQPTAMPRLYTPDASTERGFTVAAGLEAQPLQSLIHQTGFRTNAADTMGEWVVVVESREFDSGAVVYHMTVWHIAIPASAPAGDRIPRKQT